MQVIVKTITCHIFDEIYPPTAYNLIKEISHITEMCFTNQVMVYHFFTD